MRTSHIDDSLSCLVATVINRLDRIIIKGRVIFTIEALSFSAKKIEMPSPRWQDGPVKVRK